MEIYLHDCVSSEKVLNFFKKELEAKNDIHCFQFYKNNELLIKAAVYPYSNAQKRQLYSLSKSFASTAIGIACDMGLLMVSDRVVDIFKDDAPEIVSENLSLMTVHHLLTMNTGHEQCVMPSIALSVNGVKAFFENEVKYKPSTHFAYNTGATYMLSAIITKLTGMTLLDFLYEKLWIPLDITPEMWQESGGNINEGGIGLFLSCDDIVKLGLLYLNKGLYNGKRILSEKWVEEAQKPHSDNSGNGSKDWTCGYGYQFWMCANGGFRGDGAVGQYCIIRPEKNEVFAAVTESLDMQSAMDIFDELMLDYEKDSKKVVDLEKELVYGPYESVKKDVVSNLYKLEKNIQGFTMLNLKQKANKLILEFSNGEQIQTITAGNGQWIQNEIIAPAFKPALITLAPYMRVDNAKFMASYKVEDDSAVVIGVRYINCCHKGEFIIKLSDNKFEMKIQYASGSLYEGADIIKGEVV